MQASQWSISLNGGEWKEVGDFLPDWDPASIIQVRREISINPEIASSDLSINIDDLVLILTCRVGTGLGRLPRQTILTKSQILKPANPSALIELEIQGENLSGLIEFGCILVIAKDLTTDSPLAPASRGDKVWSDKQRILLEGEEPRLPIEIADFNQLFSNALPRQSPWFLLWSPRDWSRDFHGAIRLLLNENDKNLIQKIEEEDEIVLQAMMADIMDQICTRFVLDSQMEDMFSEPEPGSLAAQAVAWIKHAWPGKDIPFVRSLLANRPGEFKATILSLAAPFGP